MQQRHEIKIARTEARHTKEILDQQQSHLDRQNQETKKQSFENTFFQLLRLLTELTENMDLTGTKTQGGLTTRQTIAEGKDVFVTFSNRVNSIFEGSENTTLTFDQKYNEFYESAGSDLGHYFRTLYNIIKFIDNSETEPKSFYTNIVRAQMSDAEITVLYYNGISAYGITKFKPFIEKYGLLKNLRRESITQPNFTHLYEPTAFGKR